MGNPQLNVEITRKAKITTYPFTEYFKGFEKVEAVRRIFGEKTEDVLRNLRVEFVGRRGYMGVSDEDGHLFISASYLNNGDLIDIYLDIIHELVHVKQFMDGKELFDERYGYVDRPTEIEAYRITVEEARRLGLSNKRILEYLKTEWITEKDLKRLAKTIGVKYTQDEKAEKTPTTQQAI
ncbi:MAG: hypothetical protein QXI91_01475 [Candidatus Bathyarchaeia archaeon]